MATGEVRAIGQATAVLLAATVLRAGFTVLSPPPGSDAPAHSDVVALLDSSAVLVEDAKARSAALSPGELLDPNSASESELDRLPGIGPALASRIVAARADGAFTRPQDLERVPGIGPVARARIQDKLRFSAGSAPVLGRRTSAVPVTRSWDLESMTVEDWMRQDGIGPVLAERIVAFRRSAGGIGDLQSLLAVSGIGPATLERIRRSLAAR